METSKHEDFFKAPVYFHWCARETKFVCRRREKDNCILRVVKKKRKEAIIKCLGACERIGGKYTELSFLDDLEIGNRLARRAAVSENRSLESKVFVDQRRSGWLASV